MARDVNFSPQALVDLAELYADIAEVSPDSALRFCDRLTMAAEGLSEFPERHPVIGIVQD